MTDRSVSDALEGLSESLKTLVNQYIETQVPTGMIPDLTLLFKNANGRVIRVQAGGKDFVLKIGMANNAEDLKVVPLAISGQVMKGYRQYKQYLKDESIFLGFSKLAYYAGDNYEHVLKNFELSPYQKFYTGLEWVFALENLHLRKIIHADLKPQNMLRLANDQAVLIDFDTAQLCDEDEVVTRKTTDLGTEPYLAPESIFYHQYSQRSDIYALCVMLVRDLNLIPGSIEPPRMRQLKASSSELWPEWRFEEKENIEWTWSRNVFYRGLNRDPENRPSLQNIQGALLRMAKVELNEEEFKKLEQHYVHHKQLQVFLHIYAQKAKVARANAKLDLRLDNTLNQKCVILARHAVKPALGLALFKGKGNRTYQCLQTIKWIDDKGEATAFAPHAFRDAYEKATNLAATAVDDHQEDVNADGTQPDLQLYCN